MATVSKDQKKLIKGSMNIKEAKDEPTFSQGKTQAITSSNCYALSYAAMDVFASKVVPELKASQWNWLRGMCSSF